MSDRYEKVVRLCVECGDEFSVCKYVEAGPGNRCSRCQAERTLEQRRERRRDYAEVRTRGSYNSTAKWDLVVDPDETWGTHTALDRTEINMLIKGGMLTPGTKFRNSKDGREIVVLDKEKVLLKESYPLEGWNCVVCGSSDPKRRAHGLCARCYGKESYRRARGEKVILGVYVREGTAR
jgi:hypothetical protein